MTSTLANFLVFFAKSTFNRVPESFVWFNPFPNKLWFLGFSSRSLLKTLWEKEKLLVTSNFSFSPQCFLPVWKTFCQFYQIWNCRLQSVTVSKRLKFIVWERLKHTELHASLILLCIQHIDFERSVVCFTGTPSCVIEKDELKDEMRILVFMDGLFHEGELKAIRPPDIYGAILDNERKTRPHYFSQEEILKDAVSWNIASTYSFPIKDTGPFLTAYAQNMHTQVIKAWKKCITARFELVIW